MFWTISAILFYQVEEYRLQEGLFGILSEKCQTTRFAFHLAGRGAGSSGRGGRGRGYGGSYGYGYGGINGGGGAEDAWFDEGTPMTGGCWLLGVKV